MRKNFLIVFSMALMLIVSGCAGIEPDPTAILRHPLGTDRIAVGMVKEGVRDIWGRPDVITRTGTNELGVLCEEWVYYGRYPGLPVNAGYFHKTKRLYFEGNVLVRWKD
ncbi:MAG: hypothetical protein U9Q08_02580 [Candidatus Omnitrophota bacterium]|nr:hypothetical protein [Candidatus Omnitrophota bacterium]